MAFFGDSKTFVTNGRNRISGLEAIPNGLTASVSFASGEKSVRLDYFEIVDADSLDPVETVRQGALVPVAAVVGTTRLIDNIQL